MILTTCARRRSSTSGADSPASVATRAWSTWIYRVTLNSCVSFFRKHRRRGNTVSVDEHPELIAEDDEKGAMLREMYRMINRLPAADKALILLWLDEHSYDEIASIMGQPRNTVASRLRRAKEKLTSLTPEI